MPRYSDRAQNGVGRTDRQTDGQSFQIQNYWITAVDYQGVLSIKLQGLNLNSYIDSTKIYDYFFIMFVDNTMNRLINFIQQDDSWEYNGSIQTLNNFTFDIYMDGVIDNGITINNPFLIELEYF